mmetsp:Transcript_126172/g.288822  ORF Transcript_126172/g.288822 Transcript_126172/m.288822 type:complete len:87 (+) Transcript_126172:160-420(+)
MKRSALLQQQMSKTTIFRYKGTVDLFIGTFYFVVTSFSLADLARKCWLLLFLCCSLPCSFYPTDDHILSATLWSIFLASCRPFFFL